MLIKRVELENIKSHISSTFEFERGSTAITGENGAGKTTIIEAIAWTLFDLLAYRKDEFVTRGAKKGSARVTIESSLDEREYVIYRDTGTGYYVYDPALKIRIADKKDEVTRFLWQHIGVEPGTDLETLFKHAIGVPQGTYTAVFLATAGERKKTFDTLLKVEEYRRGADELLKTTRYIESQINAVSIKIARAEGEVKAIDGLAASREAAAEQAADLGTLLRSIGSDLEKKRLAVKHLDEVEQKLNAMAAGVEKLRADSAGRRSLFSQLEAELNRSKLAAAVIAETIADASRHTESLARLKELDRERDLRQKLREELAKTEAALANVKAEQKHLRQEVDKIQASHSLVASLRPLAAEQERLEAEAARLRAEVAKANAAAAEAKTIDAALDRLRENYRANQARLAETREKSAAALEVEKFRARESELLSEIANLKASLERDEAFQREIKNGLCPILSEKCLNLKEGQTLDGFVTSQFTQLRSSIAKLQSEHRSVASALTGAREGEKYLAQLPTLEAREREITEEGNRLKADRQALEPLLAEQRPAEADLLRAEAEIEKLDNPRTRITLLEADVRREGEIRQQISAVEKNIERLESERRITTEQLEAYKDLDTHWAAATKQRDSTADAHRKFVANESVAVLLDERTIQYQNAERELLDAAERLKAAEADYESAGKDYDRDQHLSEKEGLAGLEKREIETRTTLAVAEKREAELAAELIRLEAVRESMQDEFREKERLEKVLETTDFIRTTLKEAAPLVARNYVWHVSTEANLMYREITGNAERTLKWAEDYGIVLEEGGYDRPFVSLSGGEQMAAALSVRLALLTQLSDIRIAFFDEPTTNMDAERRENLAQQIGQIHHFDQLFVISHDDTFDSYMDHEMRVEK
ncbi:MAG: AAA family ATPase [Pyrinomonadaceae bacterium]